MRDHDTVFQNVLSRRDTCLSARKKTRTRVLSAACCLLVLCAVVGAVLLAGNSMPVYADVTQFNPPIFNLHWGMTMDEVETILKNEKALCHPVEDVLGLQNWESMVFEIPTDEQNSNTVSFHFSKPQTFNGVSYPAVLQKITILIKEKDLQKVADLLSEDLKTSYEKHGESTYFFYSTAPIETIPKEQFYVLYNLEMGFSFMKEWTKEETDAIWENAVKNVSLQHDFFPLLVLREADDQISLSFHASMEAYHDYVK